MTNFILATEQEASRALDQEKANVLPSEVAGLLKNIWLKEKRQSVKDSEA